MSGTLHLPPGWGRSGFVVVIPARNEARRLPRALAALARDGVAGDVLVAANGCEDATAAIARAYPGLPVAVLEGDPAPGGVGEVRRAAMAAAMKAAPAAGILATTDADCVVAPGWGAATVRALRLAEVACGRVVPDPGEFAALPATVRRHGALEDEVAALAAELERLEDPVPHDPLPRHGQTPGASLAFRRGAYLRAGGFEAIPCHEDRRIVGRIEAAGGRVARPWDLAVVASCRLTGRAPGGMADTIAARTADPLLVGEIARLGDERARLRAAIAAHRARRQPPPGRVPSAGNAASAPGRALR
ncbi:glycosyl transferase family 2 [Hasllibacter halocynthiae]|uniref:Glycosyl transferase family 2 n=1 Tax=Hasllibacter halocynthiae TaxID=595589 RepID=A0A2T0X4C2_9RHOB|nr:glycosyltransferase [Hasllibacter halocynthiae]PRY93789.1 glycosyl transferase family 2 [Hasllibacter halocynthiae]